MTTACEPGTQASCCDDMDDAMTDERDVDPASTLPEQPPKTNNNNLPEPNELNNEQPPKTNNNNLPEPKELDNDQPPKTHNNDFPEPKELNNNLQRKQNAAEKLSVHQTFSQIRSVARTTRLLISICIGLYLLAFLLLLVLSLQHIVRNMDHIHDSVAEMIETWLLW